MRPEPEQLAAVPLLASLKPDQLQAIASLTELRSEPEGTQLVGEGAPGYALFILIDGTATVTSGERPSSRRSGRETSSARSRSSRTRAAERQP